MLEKLKRPTTDYDLGFGHLGNGLAVWNRLDERDGDYVQVAHIGPDRKVTYYDTELPDELIKQIERKARTSNARISVTQDQPVFDTPPDTAEQPDNDYIHEYLDLQEKGIAIAKKFEKLSMQDRINIIAETFGCKTACIKTSPCTGKWRGRSDIFLVFDNGSSLGIGNHYTPKAKTKAVQNDCINSALAQFNPEIVSEANQLATAALSKLEAKDNAIAEQKGLKPYTFLSVEFNNGSYPSSSDYIGWYYVTLAVDGEVFAFFETGLNYAIAEGKPIEDISRPNYFIAGSLKESDVDFVFNNVGYSFLKGHCQFQLSDEAKERAEIKLTEISMAKKLRK